MATLNEIANEVFNPNADASKILSKLAKRVKQAKEAYEKKTGEKVSNECGIPMVYTSNGLTKFTYLDDKNKIARAHLEIGHIETKAMEAAMEAEKIDKELEQIAYTNVKLRLIAESPILNSLDAKSVKSNCEF
jgi:predicted transcriptional regulator